MCVGVDVNMETIHMRSVSGAVPQASFTGSLVGWPARPKDPPVSVSPVRGL